MGFILNNKLKMMGFSIGRFNNKLNMGFCPGKISAPWAFIYTEEEEKD